MSNTNLINDIVLPESMVILRNNTAILNSIGAHYDDSYQFHGAKVGASVGLRTAQEFTVRETMTADVQDVEQKEIPLTRSVIRGIDMKYSSAELKQDVDGFKQYRLKPAIATLAAKIDSYIYDTVSDAASQTVTIPATNLDVADVLNAGVQLDNMGAAPRDGDRMFCASPRGQADIIGDTKGLFNNATSLSKNYTDGTVSVPTLGFNFNASPNVSTHTTGSYDANYDVKTVPTSGDTTLNIDTGTGTISKGDIFTIDTVYEVNPLTKVSTGNLKHFTVTTAEATGGDVTIAITPAMISTGQYQNINELPAVNDDLVFTGAASTSYKQALAFHPNGIAVGFCDLETPTKGVVDSGRMVEDGVSISLVQWFDGINRQEYLRFDVLFGVAVPEYRSIVRLYEPA